jgi:ABC-type nitrate/sulfonate/bicarbonate transport system substrate-binding protein
MKSCGLVVVASLLLAVSLISKGYAQTVRFGISSDSPGFLPTIVAEKKGFYKKYGLNSQHIMVKLSVAMNALGTGDLDYAVTMAQGVLAAIQGIPVKAVMMTQDKLVFFLMAPPEIHKVEDLKGKTVGISYFGSTTQMVAEAILKQAGLIPGTNVNLLPSGDDQGRLLSLDTKRIQATIGSPPLDVMGKRKGYKVIAWARDYLSVPQNALITTDKKIKDSPDEIKQVIKGTIEALQFIQNNQPETVDILTKWTGLDRATAKSMFESYFPAYSTDGTMTDKSLRAAMDIAMKRAKIDGNLPISRVADRSILLDAQKELGLR